MQVATRAALRRCSSCPSAAGSNEGMRCYDGEAALIIKRWFHRTDDDASGCTFVDPEKETRAPGSPPVAMVINSSTLRGVFGPEQFTKIVPPALDLGPSSRTHGAAVVDFAGEGEIRYRLHTDTDSVLRDRCVAAGPVLC